MPACRSRALSLATALAAMLVACRDEAVDRPRAPDPLARLPEVGRIPSTLVLGVTPPVGRSTLTRVEPLARYLRARLGRPVRLRLAASYGVLGADVAAHRAQIAMFSPLAYVEARRRAPIVAIATATHNGSPTYVGYVMARRSASPRTLESLRGLRVVWVDPESTSGYLYPRALMRHRGLDPAGFFANERFVGDHFAAIRAVVRGEADVAAVSATFVDPGTAQRMPEVDQLEVVAKTSRIALDCVVVRSDTPRPLALALQRALLALDEDPAASRELAAASGIGAFVAADDARYDAVEAVLHAESR